MPSSLSKSILCVIYLSVGCVEPAAAVGATKLSDERVSNWRIAEWQATDAPTPHACMIFSPLSNGAGVLAEFEQRVPGGKLLRGYLHPTNDSWQLGPASAGTAVVELNTVGRTLNFRRSSGTEMRNDLGLDLEGVKWLGGIFAEEPVNLRFRTARVSPFPAATGR